jgi:hypothetical protein
VQKPRSAGGGEAEVSLVLCSLGLGPGMG